MAENIKMALFHAEATGGTKHVTTFFVSVNSTLYRRYRSRLTKVGAVRTGVRQVHSMVEQRREQAQQVRVRVPVLLLQWRCAHVRLREQANNRGQSFSGPIAVFLSMA